MALVGQIQRVFGHEVAVSQVQHDVFGHLESNACAEMIRNHGVIIRLVEGSAEFRVVDDDIDIGIDHAHSDAGREERFDDRPCVEVIISVDKPGQARNLNIHVEAGNGIRVDIDTGKSEAVDLIFLVANLEFGPESSLEGVTPAAPEKMMLLS